MIDVQAVLQREFPVLRQSYSEKDAILYALALGYGGDPMDVRQLRFTLEQDLQVVPTFANVLCHPGFWISAPATGIDATRAVHGEHRVVFHRPLPSHGSVRGETRVTDIIDKGASTGALVVFERRLLDDRTDELLTSIEQHTLCRGDGGFSGEHGPKAVAMPKGSPAAEGPPDWAVELATLPQAALLYRLSSDLNPLHAVPAVARAAGFPRPILHGLCTFGVICRAVLQACIGDDPARLQSLGGRFSAPVFPGETLRVEIWRGQQREGVHQLALRCVVPARNVVVFSGGSAGVVET